MPDSNTAIAETLVNPAPMPEEDAIKNEFDRCVRGIIEELEKERCEDVVKRRFGIDGATETLQEIGDDYGVSRERVRQIERNALRLLRAKAQKAGLDDAIKG